MQELPKDFMKDILADFTKYSVNIKTMKALQHLSSIEYKGVRESELSCLSTGKRVEEARITTVYSTTEEETDPLLQELSIQTTEWTKFNWIICEIASGKFVFPRLILFVPPTTQSCLLLCQSSPVVLWLFTFARGKVRAELL